MARPLPLNHFLLGGTSHIGVAAMSLLFCAFALLMCASHSFKLRRHWSSCVGEDPVIEIHNEAVTEQQEADSIWQKNILMGGKCQLPDFSGVIIYDSNGNIVTPAKTSRPLLTWK